MGAELVASLDGAVLYEVLTYGALEKDIVAAAVLHGSYRRRC